MRILIVSDTHGYHRNLYRALESAGAVDMFIHLGDVEGGEEYINAVVTCEKHIVRGNNDFFSELPKEDEFCRKCSDVSPAFYSELEQRRGRIGGYSGTRELYMGG